MLIKDALDIESIEFAQCFETEDQLEGMDAFLTKRADKKFINK